ncbi:MAG TPA: hypothetical protein VF808_08015 [Ktedonobacterales bacterium]
MPILTLLGVMTIALASAATLALRVVRVPRGRGMRAPAGRQPARMDTSKPATALVAHLEDELQRHTMGLREALNLRRARNEPEAQTRLLNARVRHAVAARALGRVIHPTAGGRLRRWMDQAWLDMYVDRVRREVGAVRVPGQTRPLAGEPALRRLVTWITGGPRAGYASDLVDYHRAQRAHARMALVQARRLVQANRQDEAQTQLWNEQDFHMRAERELGAMFAPIAPAGATSGSLPAAPRTVPLEPVTP